MCALAISRQPGQWSARVRRVPAVGRREGGAPPANTADQTKLDFKAHAALLVLLLFVALDSCCCEWGLTLRLFGGADDLIVHSCFAAGAAWGWELRGGKMSLWARIGAP